MADRTTNYGLFKPLPEEFYDVLINNKNMEIIDGELKKKYDPDNKPTAADVGAVRTYTSFEEIGLSDSDFDPADVLSNVQKIYSAMRTPDEFKCSISSSETPNFYAAMGAKITADLSLKATYSQNLHFKRSPYLLEIDICTQSPTNYDDRYSCVYRNGATDPMSTLVYTRDKNGFVNKAGDTMTNDLTVEKSSSPTVAVKNTITARRVALTAADDGKAYLYNQKEGAKRQILFLNTEDSSVAEAVQLQRQTPEKGLELYNILHTGNKPTGTYTGNGSATERTIETGGIGSVVAIWSTNSLAIIGLNCKLANIRYAQDLDREYDEFCSRVQRFAYAGIITEEDAESYIESASEEKARAEAFRDSRADLREVYGVDY